MGEQKKERGFKGVWIPAEVYLSDAVTWSAKVIFMEIHSFAENGKECFMSNDYLAEFVRISPTQVSRHISALKKIGWIEEVSFDGKTRVLRSLLLCGFPQGRVNKKRKADSTENAIPSPQKAQGRVNKKRKDNNTTTNTGTNTTYDFKNDYSFFVDLFFQFYELTFNTKPIFNEVAGVKLKSILKKLETKNKETPEPWSKERAAKFLAKFFQVAVKDKWIKQNFELPILDSKFNSIILNSATNGRHQPNTTPFSGNGVNPAG